MHRRDRGEEEVVGLGGRCGRWDGLHWALCYVDEMDELIVVMTSVCS